MVSLADPSSFKSSTPSSSRRICHLQARSMRTIRSNLIFQTTSDTRHDDRLSAETSSPLPRDSFSDDLSEYSDSFVDFRLRELAVTRGTTSTATKSVSTDPDTAADLLDLSHAFSDSFSSFNSDISGELQKLGTAWTSASADDFQCCFLHCEDIEIPSFVPDNIASWSDVPETGSPETLRPVVNALVDILESPLADLAAKRAAAGKLRLMAKHRSDLRLLIGVSSRAIPSLIPFLKSPDPATQENAVTALLNLSLEEQNKAPITAEGAIKPLIYALKTGTATAKQNSACVLLSLSMLEGNAATIGFCGAIPPLVSLLLHGSTRGKKDAVTTLYKLCASSKWNKEMAVRAGAVRPLVAMLRQAPEHQNDSGMMEKAMVVLRSLAEVAEGRDAIVEEGGMSALVEAIEEARSVKSKEFAVLTMIQLCSDSPRNRSILVGEGVIPPLAAFSQSSSARARHKAETLLRYLSDERLLERSERKGK